MAEKQHMQRTALNRFIGGVQTDLDNIDVNPQEWVLPSVNVRIFNKDGKGFIATNMGGNIKDDTYGFEISEGYKAVGACEFNGIAYIVSVNTSGGSNLTEIGCFPRPNQWLNLGTFGCVVPTASGFDRSYVPLFNVYTPDPNPIYPQYEPRLPLRTINTGYDGTRTINVIAASSYDKSVDLYLCDHVNPNYVVNTGFDENGNVTNRTITQDQFFTTLRHVPITKYYPVFVPDSEVVTDGGNLHPGTYFIYIRYCTKDYNRTNFLSEIGPIYIGEGIDVHTYQGIQEKNWITNAENVSTKKIKLHIDNLDTSYDYFELGVIRYSSISENAPRTNDIYLISKLYKIPNSSGSTSNIDVTIYGNEQEEIITLDDILNYNNKFNICKSHIFLNNRYLGANWKNSIYVDESKLAEFAQLITTLVSTQYEINDPPRDVIWGGVSEPMQYQDNWWVLNRLGYFKGEIYPFAIKFVFDNGYVSDPFPIRGQDHMSCIESGTYNMTSEEQRKGLVRFSWWTDIDNVSVRYRKISMLMTQFDATAAAFYNDNPDVFEHIIGYYLCRAERNKNLITQGVKLPCFNRTRVRTGSDQAFTYFDGLDGQHVDLAKKFPLLYGILPIANCNTGPGDFIYYSYPNSLPSATWINEDLKLPNSVALYSPELLFGENITNGNYYALRVRRNNLTPTEITTVTNQFLNKWDYHKPPYTLFWDHYFNNKYEWFPNNKTDWFSVSAVTIKQGTYNKDKWSSYMLSFYNLSYNNNIGFNWHDTISGYNRRYYNRSVFSPSYLGLECNGATDIGDSIHPEIFALYHNINDNTYLVSVLNNYEPENNEYFNIGQFKELTEVGHLVPHLWGGGDCYLQRLMFRQNVWNGRDLNTNNYDKNGNYYYHGLILSFMLESSVNFGWRNEVDFLDSTNQEKKYTFYPVCKNNNIELTQWIENEDDEYRAEALQLNDGYNQSSSGKVSFGYDEDESKDQEGYRSNRIYYSEMNVPGSFTNGYRILKLAQYKDFTEQYGDIIAIAEYRGLLLIVTKNALLQGFVDERVTQQDTAGGNTILGYSLYWLSDRVIQLADYGSQHRASVIKTFYGIYGVDFLKKKIWKVTMGKPSADNPAYSDSRSYLTAEDLTLSKKCQKWIEDVLGAYSEFTDITVNLVENEPIGTGIVSGYNQKYKEVLFTFLLDNGTTRLDCTMVFNELIDGFIGLHTYVPNLYINVNDDIFTPKQVISGLSYTTDNNMYEHDKGDYQTFYDEIEDFQLSFIVNANNKEENYSAYNKIFECARIEMNEVKFKNIQFDTEYQTSLYSVFHTEEDDIEDGAEYLDHEWRIPVTIQTSPVVHDPYDDESEMVGKWMKVTLTYHPDSDVERLLIKRVMTDFTLLIS